jgi:hypothetical protein
MSLTQKRLKEVVSYDSSTGEFKWLVSTSNRVKIGDVAGCGTHNTYQRLSVDGILYHGHRLAWLYVHGSWPTQMIDHIDGCRSNNAISNLRDVSRSVNFQNLKKATVRNKSTGVLGVKKHGLRFHANIQKDKVQTFIGSFDTVEEAERAYTMTKRTTHEGCTI